MSENSAIEWCDHTFNPWWGCARVSPACVNCYADTWARRVGFPNIWRRHGPRRLMSPAYWRNPLTWNRKAEAKGQPRFVFCASMADVFEDHPEVPAERERLWGLIDETPWLMWLLLTKRPENVNAMVPWDGAWPTNTWLGTSVETQRWADVRIPYLLDTGARTRFLSCEPLLGPVDLTAIRSEGWTLDVTTGGVMDPDGKVLTGGVVDWVIGGGESGKKVRPTDLDWFRSLRDQCQAGGISFFLKQLGGHPDKRGGEKALLDGRRWVERPEPAVLASA